MRTILLSTASFFALTVLLLVTLAFQDGQQLAASGPANQRQVNFLERLGERLEATRGFVHAVEFGARAAADPRALSGESSREGGGR